jgi:hypothetical protein
MIPSRTLLVWSLALSALPVVAGCDGVDTDPAPDLDIVTLEARAGDRRVRDWDFGETGVFLESPALGLTIANESRATSGRIDVTLHGPDAGHFVATGDCRDVFLVPRATCSLRVRFQPTTAGVRHATVRVAEDGGASVEIALTGTGTGTGSDPVLVAEDTVLDFMTTAAGDDVFDQLTASIRNASPHDITDLSFAVTGPGFALAPGGCGPTLRAFDSCLVHVSLTPRSLGALTGQLEITGGGRRATVALQAIGAFYVDARAWSGDGGAAGLVTSDPELLMCDIRCGVTSPCQQHCAAAFTGDVRVIATPGPGSVFGGWSHGPCAGSPDPVCAIPAGVDPVQVSGSWRVAPTEPAPEPAPEPAEDPAL